MVVSWWIVAFCPVYVTSSGISKLLPSIIVNISINRKHLHQERTEHSHIH